MHSNLLYLVSVALLLSFRSHAQNLSDLPTCAQSPALSAIGSTGCLASDFACLCKDNSFINAALAGAEKQCPQSDLQKVIAFAQQLCGSVGVSLSVSATSADGGSSSTPTSPPSIKTTQTPSPATTSSQSASSSSRSAVTAATTTTSQTSNGNGGGGSTTSGAGAGFDLRGVIASGAAVVGWWVFGVWA